MSERDDEHRNRCCFVHDGERCRYVASFGPGNGKLYCREHPENGDPDKLVAALEQSLIDVPFGLDYSSAAVVKRDRNQFRTNKFRAETTEAPKRLGKVSPLAMLERAAAAKTDDPMSAAARALYRDEEDAERRAIQGRDAW